MKTYDKRAVFMTVAEVLSKLGTCNRKQVGAVIVREGRCVSWGYNGAPPGQPHCEHTDDQPCTRAIHAELNAVMFAVKQQISVDGADLYVTVSPCVVCAQLLTVVSIRQVFYREEYRDRAGLELLADAGIECRAL